tara:strand:+ start:103 stop:267 length:165 start_codon:yes stop_codon:yes gene_type:complete
MVVNKYFAEENELLSMLEEGMPVEENKKNLLALRDMAQKDMAIAQERESALLKR